MKKISIVHFLFLYFLVADTSFAQIIFQRTYGGIGDDAFYSVQQTFDGGYVMAGYTNSFGAGGYDVYLVKTDSLGDTLWTRTYGGSGDDYGYFAQQTVDSGFIISGSTRSFGNGNEIIYLLKTDINGNLIWSKTFEAFAQSGHTGETGVSVHQTFDGGYILDCSMDVNNFKTLLIKTDSIGDSLWCISYGIHLAGLGFGGSIIQTLDSGYLIIGTGVKFGGDYDVVLLKTDVLGNKQWSKFYGSSHFLHEDLGYSVKQTNDGGYIIAGAQDSISEGAILFKTDLNGNILWKKSYSINSNISRTGAFCINKTNNNGFIISGFTIGNSNSSTDVLLFETDSLGDTLWTKSYGGGSINCGYSVQQTKDGGFITDGYSFGSGAGNNDGYLIKTDLNGNSDCYEYETNIFISNPNITDSNPIDTDSIATNNVHINTPISLTGNGGILNDCSTLNENNISYSDLIYIYPNPANNLFSIIINNYINNYKLEIYNLYGNLIKYNIIENTECNIYCYNMKQGVYFIRIYINNNIISRKLIIEH